MLTYEYDFHDFYHQFGRRPPAKCHGTRSTIVSRHDVEVQRQIEKKVFAGVCIYANVSRCMHIGSLEMVIAGLS